MSSALVYSYTPLNDQKETKTIDLQVSENIQEVKFLYSCVAISIIIYIGEHNLTISKSYDNNYSSQSLIERVLSVPSGGDNSRPLGNPLRKAIGKMSKKSTKTTMLRHTSQTHRRLFQPIKPPYTPKSLKSLKNIRTVPKVSGPVQKKWNHNQDCTKKREEIILQSQKEDETEGLTPQPATESSTQTSSPSIDKPENKGLTLVEDENLNFDGTIKLDKIDQIENQTGNKVDRRIDHVTKDRRAQPLIKSKSENEDFVPVYSIEQTIKKNNSKHTPELVDELHKSNEISFNSSQYDKFTESRKSSISIELRENLLQAEDTQIYTNVTHLSNTDSEPVIFAINFGHGDYPLPNHGIMFENLPIYKFNSYISDYVFTRDQIMDFNKSLSTDPTIGIRRTQAPTQTKTQAPTQNTTPNSGTP